MWVLLLDISYLFEINELIENYISYLYNILTDDDAITQGREDFENQGKLKKRHGGMESCRLLWYQSQQVFERERENEKTYLKIGEVDFYMSMFDMIKGDMRQLNLLE